MIKSFSQVPAFQKEIKHLIGDRKRPTTRFSFTIKPNANNMYAVRANGILIGATKTKTQARELALKTLLKAEYQPIESCPDDFIIEFIKGRYFVYKIINDVRLLCYKLKTQEEALIGIHYHQVFEDTNTKKEDIE